jgi:hypothetical protein
MRYPGQPRDLEGYSPDQDKASKNIIDYFIQTLYYFLQIITWSGAALISCRILSPAPVVWLLPLG